jgi:hypothetical protein
VSGQKKTADSAGRVGGWLCRCCVRQNTDLATEPRLVMPVRLSDFRVVVAVAVMRSALNMVEFVV